MAWPQITFIILFAISGTVTLLNHGKPREPFNFWVWLLAFAIELTLLIQGGFFK